MEALRSGIVVRPLSSVVEALVIEVSVAITKSLSCLLLMMGAVPNGILECRREPGQLKRLPIADLHMDKQPVPENKDASGTEEDDEDNDDKKDDDGDDAGDEREEEFSGEEGDAGDKGDVEYDPEANGGGESEEDDDDEEEEDDDDDDDDDEDDKDEEEEEEEEEEEIPRPPAKRRK